MKMYAGRGGGGGFAAVQQWVTISYACTCVLYNVHTVVLHIPIQRPSSLSSDLPLNYDVALSEGHITN